MDGPTHTDSITVYGIALEGDEVVVSVGYGGGCAEHTFEMCWNGAWLRTSPPQAPLVLGHDSGDDMCEAYLSEDLRFDASVVIDDALLSGGEDPVDFNFAIEGYMALYEF